MFITPESEDRICKMLRTMVEEFAPENIVVQLPRKWDGVNSPSSLGRVPVEYCQDNIIRIVAMVNNTVAFAYSESLIV